MSLPVIKTARIYARFRVGRFDCWICSRCRSSAICIERRSSVGVTPGYQKVLYGTLAAIQVGLEAMRNECPRFASWLSRLEASV